MAIWHCHDIQAYNEWTCLHWTGCRPVWVLLNFVWQVLCGMTSVLAICIQTKHWSTMDWKTPLVSPYGYFEKCCARAVVRRPWEAPEREWFYCKKGKKKKVISPKGDHLFGICFLDDPMWVFKVGQRGGWQREEERWVIFCLCYVFLCNLKI